jgi:hypothetical protein
MALPAGGVVVRGAGDWLMELACFYLARRGTRMSPKFSTSQALFLWWLVGRRRRFVVGGVKDDIRVATV